MANTYTLISSTTLASANGTVTISSIPSTYSDLIIAISARMGSGSGTSPYPVNITINGDGASNYSRTPLFTETGVVYSLRTSNAANVLVEKALAGPDQTANSFSNIQVYLPGYTSSSSKPFFISAGNSHALAQNDGRNGIHACLWRNSATISSITFATGGNTMAAGSSFYVYGIKNS
jgi:hypothetical protein